MLRSPSGANGYRVARARGRCAAPGPRGDRPPRGGRLGAEGTRVVGVLGEPVQRRRAPGCARRAGWGRSTVRRTRTRRRRPPDRAPRAGGRATAAVRRSARRRAPPPAGHRGDRGRRAGRGRGRCRRRRRRRRRRVAAADDEDLLVVAATAPDAVVEQHLSAGVVDDAREREVLALTEVHELGVRAPEQSPHVDAATAPARRSRRRSRCPGPSSCSSGSPCQSVKYTQSPGATSQSTSCSRAKYSAPSIRTAPSLPSVHAVPSPWRRSISVAGCPAPTRRGTSRRAASRRR